MNTPQTTKSVRKPRVLLLDNHDSFVYNLADALSGYDTTVVRNSVTVTKVLEQAPDMIVLSPGPGHPTEAGCMMELVDKALGKIPLLGICLGFQALLEHFGGEVAPCGPVHGSTDTMVLNANGAQHPIFKGLTTDMEPDQPNYIGTNIPIARYHSLGCTNLPTGLQGLAYINDIVMAAETTDGMALGLQFHPESLLTPSGPIILERCIEKLSSTLQ